MLESKRNEVPAEGSAPDGSDQVIDTLAALLRTFGEFGLSPFGGHLR